MITIVSGLGRSGMSVVMQMLAAAGAPVVGSFPTYETGRMARLWSQLCEHDGKIVRVDDPLRKYHPRPGPDFPVRAIYCYRQSFREQAKSAIAHTTGGLWFTAAHLSEHEAVERVRRDLEADEPKTRQIVTQAAEQLGCIAVSFEELITNTRGVAQAIQEFLRMPPAAVAHMAAQVRHRTPACQPTRIIEAQLRRLGRPRTIAEAMARIGG